MHCRLSHPLIHSIITHPTTSLSLSHTHTHSLNSTTHLSNSLLSSISLRPHRTILLLLPHSCLVFTHNPHCMYLSSDMYPHYTYTLSYRDKQMVPIALYLYIYLTSPSNSLSLYLLLLLSSFFFIFLFLLFLGLYMHKEYYSNSFSLSSSS